MNTRLAPAIAAAATAAGYTDSANLPQLIAAVSENAVGVPDAFAMVPGGGVEEAVRDATAAAFRDTYARAFRMVFYASIPFGVVTTACAWFVEDPSPLLTDHVAVVQERDVLAGKGVAVHHHHHGHGGEGEHGEGVEKEGP